LVELEVVGNASREELEHLARALDAALRSEPHETRSLGVVLTEHLGAGWVVSFETRIMWHWRFTVGTPAPIVGPCAGCLRGPVVVHSEGTYLFLLRAGERAPVVVWGAS
jgi:hypothetical protein